MPREKRPLGVLMLDADWQEVINKKYGENSLEAHFARALMDAMEDRLPAILEELFELFARKQADYGPNNIALAGTTGIVVRLGDKMSRVTNLIRAGKLEDPQNESVEDTFKDLSVYPIMALLTYRGLWPTVSPEEAWDLNAG